MSALVCECGFITSPTAKNPRRALGVHAAASGCDRPPRETKQSLRAERDALAVENERLREFRGRLVEDNAQLGTVLTEARRVIAAVEALLNTMGGQVGHCEWGCVDDVRAALAGDQP